MKKLKILHDKLSMDRIIEEFYELDSEEKLFSAKKGAILCISDYMRLKEHDIILVEEYGDKEYRICDEYNTRITYALAEIVDSFTTPLLSDSEKLEKIKAITKSFEDGKVVCNIVNKESGKKCLSWDSGCITYRQCGLHISSAINKILE